MQLGRVGKEVGADPVERLTVVQPGEDIVVALPLNALLSRIAFYELLNRIINFHICFHFSL